MGTYEPMIPLHLLLYFCVGYLCVSACLRTIAFAKGRGIPWSQPAWDKVTTFADDRLNKAQNTLNVTSLIAVPLGIVLGLIIGIESTAALIVSVVVMWAPMLARSVFYECCFTFADLEKPPQSATLGE